MNTGDTAFMMICAALVFFMTPGLAFFYGGLVRRKNVCNTIMACDVCNDYASTYYWFPGRAYEV